MKHVITLVILLVLSTAVWSVTNGNQGTNTPDPLKGVIKIPDARKNKEPGENLSSHKPYDVVVFRTTFFGNAYQVRYYQFEKDSLNSHTAIYCTSHNFNRAEFNWITDSSVSIRLYHTKTKKEAKFKVFGYGLSSGLADW